MNISSARRERELRTLRRTHGHREAPEAAAGIITDELHLGAAGDRPRWKHRAFRFIAGGNLRQALEARFKLRYGQRKWLHRRVCERFLPREILARKKRGFAVDVVDQWFNGSIDSKLSGYLLDGESLMFQFLRPRAVSQLLDEHRAGRRDGHKLLFSLVVLEEWLRANSGSSTATPPASTVTSPAAAVS